jgi:glycosyltransferase involved in cell wall biosynthesis
VPSLSAFFPAFNEEANIVAVATAILRVLPAVADDWELIVVDDGSSDLTGSLADALARSEPRVRVIHHPMNRGYGAAVRSGLAAARHDFVFLTDGDRQFDPAQLRYLLAEIGDADVVVGYRRRRADHVLRRFNTWAWNLLVGTVFRLRIRDVNCAFKLFRREVLSRLPLRAEGAMVSTELLALTRRSGWRVVEVPVDHFPRLHGTASGGRPSVIMRGISEFLRLAGRLHRWSPERVPEQSDLPSAREDFRDRPGSP